MAEIPADLFLKRYATPIIREPVIKETPSFFSASTVYTTIHPNGLVFSEEYQEYAHTVPSNDDSLHQQKFSYPFPEEIVFQDTEFTFLNGLSETANPSHTIDQFTWVSEETVTTCEREAGATEAGHADVTVDGTSMDSYSVGTSDISTELCTSKPVKEQWKTETSETSRTTESSRSSSSTKRRSSTMTGSSTRAEPTARKDRDEESAVLEGPGMTKVGVLYFFLFMWMGLA